MEDESRAQLRTRREQIRDLRDFFLQVDSIVVDATMANLLEVKLSEKVVAYDEWFTSSDPHDILAAAVDAFVQVPCVAIPVRWWRQVAWAMSQFERKYELDDDSHVVADASIVVLQGLGRWRERARHLCRQERALSKGRRQ